MMIQVSSGVGPIECQKAVGKVVGKLVSELSSKNIKFSYHEKHRGANKQTYKSIVLSCESSDDLPLIQDKWEGTICWISSSPYRPNYKRKNWFVSVKIFKVEAMKNYDKKDIVIETFRSSGPGGQHANKTDSAVRVKHLPTGEVSTCSKERSQFQNKQVALFELQRKLNAREADKKKAENSKQRHAHYELERGRPKLIFRESL